MPWSLVMADPSVVNTLYKRGLALYRAGQPAAAAEALQQAVVLDSTFILGYNALGVALAALGLNDAALASYARALALNPDFVPPHINRALVLSDLRRFDAALASLDHAIALEPNNADAHGNRGSVLTEMKQYGAAVASIDRALALKPAYPFLPGIRLVNKVYVCDWAGLERDLAELSAKLDHGEPASPPWPLLALSDDARLQRIAATTWAAAKCPPIPSLGPIPKWPRHERTRLGYFSADFHAHATAYLIAGLFERHDRSQFEVIAFSFGAETGDEAQRRLKAGSDRFVDLRTYSSHDAAALARALEIDIAIDLKGYTENMRMDIFAHRAAPVQVNYLGYPGTLGAPYIDYIIADAEVIPENAQGFYTEKVITLPDCYQVNDRQRQASDRIFTRGELSLPETGFVFCCFNNNFKITPKVFDVWMRILAAVPGAVLWLIEDNAIAAANLRTHAASRGVDPARLIFAPRVTLAEHLARQRAADLFLDTLPYNAHTTASDALWMGLPLLTCPGGSFSSRVAASLLRTIGLPEMIAPTLEDYEKQAIELATAPARLAQIRQKLIENRLTTPLFDIDRFTRNIEAAYRRMMGDLPRP